MSEISFLPQSSIQISTRQRKKFPAAAMEELETSIEEVGLLQPCIVNLNTTEDTYELVAGERRFRSIHNLHEAKIPVLFAGEKIDSGVIPCVLHIDMTELDKATAELHENVKRLDLPWQEVAAATALLHKLRKEENPEQTYTKTAEEIKRVKGDTTPVKTADRTAVSESILLADFLEVEEVQKAPTQKRAMKFIEQKLQAEFAQALDRTEFTLNKTSPHTLYHKDMREAVTLLSPGTFDICLTDPPYNVGVKKFGDASQLTHQYSEEDAVELYAETVKAVTLLCKPEAIVYLFVDFDMFPSIRKQMEEAGWNVRRRPIIWGKGNSGHLTDGVSLGYRSTYECVLYASRGGKLCTALSNDILVAPHETDRIHAAQKPQQLLHTLLSQAGRPGDTVLDLFAGSGSIFPAAIKLSMIVTAFEKEEEFISGIEARQGLYREQTDA